MSTSSRPRERASDTPRAPVTDRVNVEPAILHGMTVTEAKVIGAVSLAIFLLAGGIVSAATGRWQAVMLMAVFGPALTLWFASQYLARIKRGRPDAYYTQAIHLWLVGRGLATPRFITHHGWWSLGRTLDLSLASPLDPPPEKPLRSPDAPRTASRARAPNLPSPSGRTEP